MVFPMELRCRVKVCDVEHRLRRSVEVQARSLVDAAGNHQATISVEKESAPELQPEEYRIDFVVSRTSLFQANQWKPYRSFNCTSRKGRLFDADLRLSSLDPDDPMFRAMLKE